MTRLPTIKPELPTGVLNKPTISPNDIFIRGEVYSSKNSKQIWKKSAKKSNWKYNGKPVLPFITDSNQVKRYKIETKKQYISFRKQFQGSVKGYPVRVEFTFIRGTKGIWDFNNMTEMVQDMMVECEWLPDDSMFYLIPVCPVDPPFYIDKENVGVIIKVLQNKSVKLKATYPCPSMSKPIKTAKNNRQYFL